MMDFGPFWAYLVAALGGGGLWKLAEYFFVPKSKQVDADHNFIQQLLGRVTELERRIDKREEELRVLLQDNGRLQAKVETLMLEIQLIKNKG